MGKHKFQLSQDKLFYSDVNQIKVFKYEEKIDVFTDVLMSYEVDFPIKTFSSNNNYLAVGYLNGLVDLLKYDFSSNFIKIVTSIESEHKKSIVQFEWNNYASNILAAIYDRSKFDYSLKIWDMSNLNSKNSSRTAVLNANNISRYPNDKRSQFNHEKQKMGLMKQETYKDKKPIFLPLFASNMSDTINSFCWIPESKCNALLGLNHKQIKNIDIREKESKVTTSFGLSGGTFTKAVFNIEIDPYNTDRCFSVYDNQIHIWDRRRFEKGVDVFYLPISRSIYQISWCPYRKNLCCALPKESRSLYYIDFDITPEGNNCRVTERSVKNQPSVPFSKYYIKDFAWTPNLLNSCNDSTLPKYSCLTLIESSYPKNNSPKKPSNLLIETDSFDFSVNNNDNINKTSNNNHDHDRQELFKTEIKKSNPIFKTISMCEPICMDISTRHLSCGNSILSLIPLSSIPNFVFTLNEETLDEEFLNMIVRKYNLQALYNQPRNFNGSFHALGILDVINKDLSSDDITKTFLETSSVLSKESKNDCLTICGWEFWTSDEKFQLYMKKLGSSHENLVNKTNSDTHSISDLPILPARVILLHILRLDIKGAIDFLDTLSDKSEAFPTGANTLKTLFSGFNGAQTSVYWSVNAQRHTEDLIKKYQSIPSNTNVTNGKITDTKNLSYLIMCLKFLLSRCHPPSNQKNGDSTNNDGKNNGVIDLNAEYCSNIDTVDKIAISILCYTLRQLRSYLTDLSRETISNGKIEGILLIGMGNNPDVLFNLLQNYIDISDDIISPLAIIIKSDIKQLNTHPIFITWLNCYRAYLNRCGAWEKRAEFDIFLRQRTTLPSYNTLTPYMFLRCNFCGKRLPTSAKNESLSSPKTRSPTSYQIKKNLTSSLNDVMAYNSNLEILSNQNGPNIDQDLNVDNNLKFQDLEMSDKLDNENNTEFDERKNIFGGPKGDSSDKVKSDVPSDNNIQTDFKKSQYKPTEQNMSLISSQKQEFNALRSGRVTKTTTSDLDKEAYKASTNKPSKITRCPYCKKPLPRCAICLANMTYYIAPQPSPVKDINDKSITLNKEKNESLTSNTNNQEFKHYNALMEKDARTFDLSTNQYNPISNWFTWCQACQHGGHADHMSQWFSLYQECPVSGCPCQCVSLNIPSSPV